MKNVREKAVYMFLFLMILFFFFSGISSAQYISGYPFYGPVLSPYFAPFLGNYGFNMLYPYNSTNFISSGSSFSTIWPALNTFGYDYPKINSDIFTLGIGYQTFGLGSWPFYGLIPTLPAYYSSSYSSSNEKPELKPYEFVSAGAIPQSEGYTEGYDPYSGSSGSYGSYGSYSGTSYQEPRQIEAADIIKIDGTELYILNEYRGLIICDITQPDNPSITGKAPIIGCPEEMYIRDDRAYIIVTKLTNSGFYYPSVSSQDESLSRVLVIDLSDKSEPQIIGSFDMDGEVTDSRMVGDILYVVSSKPPEEDEFINQEPQSDIHVSSLDVSDPGNIHVVDQVVFGGAAKYIHVTEEAIFIIAGIEFSAGDETIITSIDISNPAGSIHTAGLIAIPGLIKDEFKIDYYDGYLRVCTYEWLDYVSNLYIIDANDLYNLHQVGMVELGQGDQLFATRFDEDRGYMVTFDHYDAPLWLIDLSDPYNPQVRGEINLPGRCTCIEPRGDRLIALGTERASSRRVYISLYNVSDLDFPGLIEHLFFGNQEGWSSSGALDDEKALTVLDDLDLIVLPYSISDYVEGRHYNDERLQLIDYSANDLTARGWVSQKGKVLRSQSFAGRLFSISAKQLQVIEASDRDYPQITASLPLIRDIVDFIPLNNGYGIQLIREDSDYYNYTLRTVPIAEAEDGQAVGTIWINYENPPFLIGNGNLVYIIREKSGSSSSDSTRIRIFDFSDVLHPQARGCLDIPGRYTSLKSLRSANVVSTLDADSAQVIIQLKNDVLVFNNNGFLVVDLSDPDNPILAAQIPIDIATPRGLFAKNEILYFSYYLPYSENSQYYSASGYQAQPEVQYYLGRIDFSDPLNPVELEPINIPGFCVGLSDAGNFIYTIDKEWDQPTIYAHYSQIYSFNVVEIIDEKAYLSGQVELNNSFTSAVIDNGYAYLAITPEYNYNSYYGSYQASSNEFAIIALADPENPIKYEHLLSGSGGTIFASQNQRVFVSANGGISCYDVTNPGQPQLEEYRGLAGQSSRIIFSDGKAYLPLGNYGLWVKSL